MTNYGATMTTTQCSRCGIDYDGSLAAHLNSDIHKTAVREADQAELENHGWAYFGDDDEDPTVHANAGRDGHSSAAAAARIDAAAAGNHGGPGKGTGTGNLATEKQVSFLKSLCAERPAWAEKVGYNDLTIAGLSKRAASQAIDDALHIPKEAAPVGHPATDKQKTFVRTLLAERTGNPAAEAIRDALNKHRVDGTLNAAVVSAAITALLETPKAPAAEIEAGVYVLANGNLARVYFGQHSGHMLLKEVIDGELEYRGKAERFLAGSRKATVEEVGNWGRATGTCLVCSRRLDDPESVDRGIGPVCYARMMGGGD